MTTPTHDAELVRTATEHLLSATVKLDPSAIAEPSQLPGWTRGHVLAHLARNADALVNVLAGKPMYASAEARDADIERGAPRTLDDQVDDVRTSASRLESAFASLGEEDWARTVTLRNGVTDLASSLPFRRWIEVELHHVDMGIGYKLEDLPGSFLDRELTNMAGRFLGHPDVPVAVELRAEDGRTWRTGAREAGEEGLLVVVGGPVALVGWLTGRTTGSGLSASGSLPPLPAL
ncbi:MULTISPECIES: maleylpyruvate isomerase family mycothiol-dependent enzyme [unclassified Streptomyces]|uniref:maleylpyruvate isomerase family mycothiol-dependent enzyme n=1 Tax=unclassified Streptomyces TaxID=2593676 RepID=UPI002DDB72F3|nr:MULTISPECIES: maleylpyruvate isomerase family mycothiol-dependent enzyme [unclassified Streptomyces]WSA95590.1 maleylpyruvate isomerase family mycothiol-dependent enzyme [Streptomyces sp. NBC_01795]WSB80008.1 maleylpyruvate isomerase family mycothiol-dependent enzyme [Streptomyces sp. NBC_01775]WSS40497.1 maleylpyruvate isomerase family mycothiol-dependent enzyme [Streptomyces sp. NBC_01187]